MIRLDGVRYAYPDSERFALEGVDLGVDAGQRVLVAGPSGCGKSTLLRVINGLVPHFYGGRFGGRARIAGIDTRHASPQELAGVVGTVFQDLPARFLTGSVRDEIAFSLELGGVRPGETAAGADEIAERMGLARRNGQSIENLSAGEQARLAMAAAAARRPHVLVLDEPLTHIDPQGARAAIEWVQGLSAQAGTTVVVAEHRVAGWSRICGRTIRMDGAPPQTVSSERADGVPVNRVSGPAALRADGLHFAYRRDRVLRGVDLEVRPGELTALIGRNGSGKTTLLRCLVGLEHPQAGRVLLDGRSIAGGSVGEVARRVGYVPQAPSSLLFADTVAAELEMTLRASARNGAAGSIHPWLEAFGLNHLAQRYPRDLSAGERQRVALAAILAASPPLLLLDEPTLGMDRRRMDWLGRLLRRLCAAGAGVLVATHDPAFVAVHADRALLLADGGVQAEGKPSAVLAADPAYAEFADPWPVEQVEAAGSAEGTATYRMRTDADD
jgi:energy-coupling factor transport system ATP-binding protein